METDPILASPAAAFKQGIPAVLEQFSVAAVIDSWNDGAIDFVKITYPPLIALAQLRSALHDLARSNSVNHIQPSFLTDTFLFSPLVMGIPS